MFKICKKSVKSTDKVCEKYVETMVKTGGNRSENANAQNSWYYQLPQGFGDSFPLCSFQKTGYLRKKRKKRPVFCKTHL